LLELDKISSSGSQPDARTTTMIGNFDHGDDGKEALLILVSDLFYLRLIYLREID
jgi:hypothetical protein